MLMMHLLLAWESGAEIFPSSVEFRTSAIHVADSFPLGFNSSLPFGVVINFALKQHFSTVILLAFGDLMILCCSGMSRALQDLATFRTHETQDHDMS